MEHLEDTLDTGQTEDRLCQFKLIKDQRGSYSSSDPEYLEVVTTYLLHGKLGR